MKSKRKREPPSAEPAELRRRETEAEGSVVGAIVGTAVYAAGDVISKR